MTLMTSFFYFPKDTVLDDIDGLLEGGADAMNVEEGKKDAGHLISTVLGYSDSAKSSVTQALAPGYQADEKGASQIVAESGAALETSLCSVDTEAEVGTA